MRAKRRISAGALTAVLCAGLIVGATGLGTPQAVAAEDYPSWSDVEQARGSEQTKQAEIRRITDLINTLSSAASDARNLATKRSTEYQEAVDTLDTATGEAEALQAEADTAQAKADDAVDRVARLIAQMARTGGDDLTVSLFLNGPDADELLSKLGTASKLAERSDDLYADAAATKNVAKSLAAQARVAQKALTALADQASDALATATEAAQAAEAAVTEQKQNEDRLQAQLAVLRDDRMSIEQGYATGEQRRQAAAAAAAAEEAARAAAAATAPAAAGPAPAAGSAGGGWTMPIRSYGNYQAYGMRLHPIAKVWRLHAGADFGAACGTGIFAAGSGRVTFAGPSGSYGNLVVIDHGGGITTAYAHMFSSGVLVRTGAQVAAGQQIAAVGTAGLSTGCHLHFELRRNGVATDPIAYMRANGMR